MLNLQSDRLRTSLCFVLKEGAILVYSILNSSHKSLTFQKWIDVNRIYLCVPYEFIDEVKGLGGKFDSKLKKWYITSYNEDLEDFIYTPKLDVDDDEEEDEDDETD